MLYLVSCQREQTMYFWSLHPPPDSLGDRRALWNTEEKVMAQAALRVVSKEQNNDRKRALEAALSQIDRAFGKGSVMKLGSRDLGLATDAVSTGSLGLDIALGIGGVPRGRVLEVYGPESSGQATPAPHVGAGNQNKGGHGGQVDA